MKVLGIAAPFGHDASAALLIDGKVIAAAEEERFTRKKHASGQQPVNAVRFCLETAGIKPNEVDVVAYPWSLAALRQKRAEYFFRNAKEWQNQKNFVDQTFLECGIPLNKTRIEWVEHHIAHTASSYYLSGFKEAAVLSLDGGGEITSTFLGYARDAEIHKLKEIVAPDSLGNFYATMTDYLGFEREDGEYKVMGMAPYGDPNKVKLDHIVWWDEKKKTYHCNEDYVWVKRSKRFRPDKVYSKKMVEELGPERTGDGLASPYVDIAAATQAKLEEIAFELIDAYLLEELKKHGSLCFAGGCALNVSLNRKLLEHPHIKRLWVQPASHDAGGSLGAAVYVAAQWGDRVEPMQHVYLGHEFSNQEIESALKTCGFKYEFCSDIAQKASDLLIRGQIVGWFQGRMEWGPRALGNRSILGNPTVKGTNDKINSIIKFRENWRPFCPSILKEYAAEILGTQHPAPFMTLSFKVAPQWRNRIPEAVHADGTARPQVVNQETNPKYYQLIKLFYEHTGIPLLINTSLNRRGEPMACSPKDALLMFKGSGLENLAIGDYLVTK